jgi:ribosome-binding ATPase
MKVGLVGYAGSGKSTVFQWLTGVAPDPAAQNRGQVGTTDVPDERLAWLSQHFKPKKTTYAKLEIVDTPGLLTTEKKDNPRRLSILREADGLVIVLTGFSGDPVAELQNFRTELAFADLEIITNRISRLEGQMKKPKPAKEREADEEELALLKRIATALEANQSPATLGLHENEEKQIRSFQLLTLKTQLALVNIGDSQIGKPVPDGLLALDKAALPVPVKLELELAELSESDRAAFMQDLGLTKFYREEAIRHLFYNMGQIVFFTVGEDECRSWPIKGGIGAQPAAGVIHTDLSIGFVRAEVVAFEDFKKVGSMKEAKTHGVYRLESKTYVVKDGDIMHILANK